MNNKICRMLATMLLMLCALAASAQQAADNLFIDGQRKQSVMTIASQNAAIQRFSQARTAYDSQSKKQQCTMAIQVSNNIIAMLKKKTPTVTAPDNKKEPVVEEPIVLTLDCDSFIVDSNGSALVVKVKTNAKEWDVATLGETDNKPFATERKDDETTVTILVPQNYATSSRYQRFVVTAGDKRQEISLCQKGIPNLLSISESVITVKPKQTKKTVAITCNAECDNLDNPLQNWRVASCPDWVHVSFNSKKTLDYNKKKGNPSSASGTPQLLTSYADIVIDAIPKGSTEASTGRIGEIVFQANETFVTVTIKQQK